MSICNILICIFIQVQCIQYQNVIIFIIMINRYIKKFYSFKQSLTKTNTYTLSLLRRKNNINKIEQNLTKKQQISEKIHKVVGQEQKKYIPSNTFELKDKYCNPKVDQTLIQQIKNLINLKKYVEAKKWFIQKNRYVISDSKLRQLKGDMHFLLFQFQYAHKQYKKAIQLDPSNIQLYRKKAEVNIRTNHFHNVLIDLKKVIQLEPDKVQNICLYAQIANKMKLPDLAIQQLLKIIYLKPNYTKSHFNLSIAYYLKGDYDNSLMFINKAFKTNSKQKQHNLYNHRGKVYIGMQKYRQGQQDLNKSIEIQCNWSNLKNRGIYLISQKRYKQGIQDLKRSLEMRQDPKLHYMIQQTLKKMQEEM